MRTHWLAGFKKRSADTPQKVFQDGIVGPKSLRTETNMNQDKGSVSRHHDLVKLARDLNERHPFEEVLDSFCWVRDSLHSVSGQGPGGWGGSCSSLPWLEEVKDVSQDLHVWHIYSGFRVDGRPQDVLCMGVYINHHLYHTTPNMPGKGLIRVVVSRYICEPFSTTSIFH